MSLPAELRNQIYALALTDPNDICLVSKTKRYRRTVERSLSCSDKSYSRNYYRRHTPSQSSEGTADVTLPDLVPNLLLLNQAIHAESQPILYAGNTFAVEDTTAMHAFLAKIGPKNRATITDLRIKGWGYTKAHKALNHPALTMLVDAVNLEHLHLDCQIGWGGGPKKIAKQLYRDGFYWLEAVGTGKRKCDAAVEIIEIANEYLTRNIYFGVGRDPKPDELMEEFRAELRRLLS